MPDLSGLPALDVALGLAFLFFLLSTVCSAVNEIIAGVLGWRAKTLEDAIRSVLGDSAPKGQRIEQHEGTRVPVDLTTQVLDHWRITALVRDPNSSRRRRKRPSYMPAHAFSLALAETLAAAPKDAAEASAWKLADSEILSRAQAAVAELPGAARPVLHKALVTAGGDLEHFRRHVEVAFDDSMKRASGWYKRKVQATLAVIALVMVVGLDIDAVRVANRLWTDDALRGAVVAKAGAAGQGAGGISRQPQSAAQRAADEVTAVKQLDLPIGWGAANNPPDVVGLLGRIPGWLITVAAVMLGAPFWFDLLSRVVRLRGSGDRHEVGRADLVAGPRHDAQKPVPAVAAKAEGTA